jgi:glucose 1-dehydrogenase
MVNDVQGRVVLSGTPIDRGGEASELAGIAFLPPSDDAAPIIGPTIYPDGGRLILNETVPVND